MREAGEQGGAAMPKVDDPVNPYRPITRLTSTDEQMGLNNQYTKQSQALIAECGQKSKASSSAQRTAASTNTGYTTTSQMKELNAAKAENKPAKKQVHGGGGSLSAGLGTTRADYLERGGVISCFDRTKGHMAKVTADKIEAKLKASSGIPEQKRKEWQEDIAAWREAEKAGADQFDPR